MFRAFGFVLALAVCTFACTTVYAAAGSTIRKDLQTLEGFYEAYKAGKAAEAARASQAYKPGEQPQTSSWDKAMKRIDDATTASLSILKVANQAAITACLWNFTSCTSVALDKGARILWGEKSQDEHRVAQGSKLGK
jgi:hypothetical protein